MRQKSTSLSLPSSEVIIVGGNHSGLSLAALLGSLGFDVLCLERAPLRSTKSGDGRTIAISLNSKRLLLRAGVWPLLAAAVCPIDAIRIADGTSHATLDFDHREVGNEPFGWIVENHLFLAALLKRLDGLKNVRLVRDATVTALDGDAPLAKVTLADGRVFTAPLVVAADGRTSVCRGLAGIETYGWDYGQTALVCNIAHTLPHNHIAVEHFLPGGPFAVLPMTDANRHHRSSVVWTESAAIAAAVTALNDSDFTALLQDKVAAYLGNISLAGKRQSYQLQLQHAKTYIAPRLVLIGDAAHGIHPIAGQGFNLGMGDCSALADLLVESRSLGLDLGASAMLRQYEKRRKVDNGNMVLATDLLDRLFSNAIPPVQAARRFGLGMVSRLPPLKRFFMRTAMGLQPGAKAA